MSFTGVCKRLGLVCNAEAAFFSICGATGAFVGVGGEGAGVSPV